MGQVKSVGKKIERETKRLVGIHPRHHPAPSPEITSATITIAGTAAGGPGLVDSAQANEENAKRISAAEARLAAAERELAALTIEEARAKAEYDINALALTTLGTTTALIENACRDFDALIAGQRTSLATLNVTITNTVNSIIDGLDSFPTVKNVIIHQLVQGLIATTPETDPELYSVPDFAKEKAILLILQNSRLNKQLDAAIIDEESGHSLAEDLFGIKDAAIAKAALLTFADLNTPDAKGYTVLHRAIETGDINLVKATIRLGGSPSIHFPTGETCLSKCAGLYDVAALRSLISLGMEFDPMIALVACQRGDREMFDFALTTIANPDFMLKNGHTLLTAAMLNTFVYGVDKLLAAGANINLPNTIGETPLLLAAKTNCYDYIKDLLELGATPHAKDAKGESALHHIIRSLNNHIRVTKDTSFFGETVLFGVIAYKECSILTSYGSIISAVRGLCLNGDDMLQFGSLTKEYDISVIQHKAANFDRAFNIIKLLVTQGIDIHTQNNDGLTPFFIACTYNWGYLARLLVAEYPIDDKVKDIHNNTALHYATILRDNGEALKTLLPRCDINTQNKASATPLYWAALYNRIEQLEILLSHDADHTITTANGWLAVHIAAHNGNVPLLKKLLPLTDKNVYTVANSQKEKATPFTLAAAEGKIEAMEFLLSQGVDINTPTAHARTALSLAISTKHSEAATFLITKGADVNKPMNDGDAPMHMAAYSANLEGFTILVNAGAEINCVNDTKLTPLHLLITYDKTTPEQKLPCAHYLLEHGANPTIADEAGNTCFTAAASYPSIAELLRTFAASSAIIGEAGAVADAI